MVGRQPQAAQVPRRGERGHDDVAVEHVLQGGVAEPALGDVLLVDEAVPLHHLVHRLHPAVLVVDAHQPHRRVPLDEGVEVLADVEVGGRVGVRADEDLVGGRLPQEDLDGLPHGEGLAGAVGADDEDGRQPQGERRRDGEDGLLLLGVERGARGGRRRLLDRPLLPGRPGDGVPLGDVGEDEVEVLQSVDGRVHLAGGDPVELELHLHLELLRLVGDVVPDEGGRQPEVHLVLPRVLHLGHVGDPLELVGLGSI